jgi:predicted house-cleaning noncanonical NTP pyrophosphatase (MazG superfamily)
MVFEDPVKAVRLIDKNYTPGPDKPQFCSQPGKVPETLADLPDDAIKDLIKGINDNQCKNTLDLEVDTYIERNRKEAAVLGIGATPAGGIGAGGTGSDSQNKAGESLVANSFNEGCMTFLYNEFSSFKLSVDSVCRARESDTINKIDASSRFSFSIEIGPTKEQSEAIIQSRKDVAINYNNLIKSGLTGADLNNALINMREMDKVREQNYTFKLEDAVISMLVENSQDLGNTNNMMISSEDDYKETLEEKLNTELTNDLRQKYGLGSGSLGDIKEVISGRVKNARENKFDDIIKQANENKIQTQADGSLVFKVNNSISRINVDLKSKNMSFLRTEVVQKAVSTLAKDMSQKIVFDILNGNKEFTESDSLVDMQRELNEGLAKLAEALKPPSLFGDGGLGGLMGGGLIFLLIGAFIFYKLFFSGPIGTAIKIGLVVLVIAGTYAAIAYLLELWPFSSDKNKRNKKEYNKDYNKDYKYNKKINTLNSSKSYNRRPYNISNKFKPREELVNNINTVLYTPARITSENKNKRKPY